MSVNKVILIGNVGKDPECRTMPDGATVANFNLATTERYKDRNGDPHENTEWHNIVAWRGAADLVSKYTHKGDRLYVEGRLRTRSYDDKDGVKRYVTEIVADSIQFLSPRKDEQPQPQTQQQRPAPARQASRQRVDPADITEVSDDLPL